MRRTVEEDESASEVVKRGVATLEECQPSSLGTLEEVVDPDELDNHVDSSPSEGSEGGQPMTFRYCGYSIEVHSHGTILIEK